MKQIISQIKSTIDALIQARTAAYLFRMGRWEASKKVLNGN